MNINYQQIFLKEALLAIGATKKIDKKYSVHVSGVYKKCVKL